MLKSTQQNCARSALADMAISSWHHHFRLDDVVRVYGSIDTVSDFGQHQ